MSTITAFEFTDNPLWRVGQGLDHVQIELTYKLPTNQPTSVEQKEKPIMSNPKRGKAKRRTEPAPSAGEWPRQPLPAEQPSRQQPTRSCKTPKKQPLPPPLRECQPPATPTVTIQPTTIQRPTKPTTPPTTLPPPILNKQPPPQTPAAAKQPPTKQPPTKHHQQPPPPKKPTKPPVLNPKKRPLDYYLHKGYKITNIYGERRSSIHHYYCTMQRNNEEPTYIICQNKPLGTNILILKNSSSKYHVSQNYQNTTAIINRLEPTGRIPPDMNDYALEGLHRCPNQRLQPAP